MTMRYTHIGIDDQAKAVANLPAPKLHATSAPTRRDAYALHFWRLKWLELASRDAELHDVIAAWSDLAEVSRKAVVAFIAARIGPATPTRPRAEV